MRVKDGAFRGDEDEAEEERSKEVKDEQGQLQVHLVGTNKGTGMEGGPFGPREFSRCFDE